jgi:hypothetical protein
MQTPAEWEISSLALNKRIAECDEAQTEKGVADLKVPRGGLWPHVLVNIDKAARTAVLTQVFGEHVGLLDETLERSDGRFALGD